MNIEWLENGYTDHGCKILPYGNTKVGKIDYNAYTTNHDFGGAYKHGGLFDWLDKAKTLLKEQYPDAQIVLAIPDLVFRVEVKP